MPAGKTIAVWPSRVPTELQDRADDAGASLARIEDGFVRSVGLGSKLHPPRSIVVDMAGIYYDPSRPSDLELILSTANFTDELKARAGRLIQVLIAGGITKYAAGNTEGIELPSGVRKVLVPGQVEDDLAVRLGAGGVTGNLDLLRRARAAEPDAWIAYRPHPDVAAGLRKGHVAEREALRYADAVVPHGSMAALLDQVDCVHALTSLAGLEALMRRRAVVTHGQPFYAGWGLTTDLGPSIPRRKRLLSLEELIAGALILYPRYLDPETSLPCPPEVVVERHSRASSEQSSLLARMRTAQGKLALVGRKLAGVSA
nr:hypothetical protein [Sphingomonas sp. dw_22]